MKRVLVWLAAHWQAHLQTARSDIARTRRWLKQSGPFYVGSALGHLIIAGALVSWSIGETAPEPRRVKAPVDNVIEMPIGMFQLGTPTLQQSELSVASLALVRPPAQTEKHFDQAAVFEDAGGGRPEQSALPVMGGLGGFNFSDTELSGPIINAEGGVGIGIGTSGLAGNGGRDEGFSGYGHGMRGSLDGQYAQQTERAVAAAINWLHRHQDDDGSWSLHQIDHQCEGEPCTGAGRIESSPAGTALGVLPLLAAGQTPTATGPYQRTVSRAIDWLIAHQTADGDLSAESEPKMYVHALAALTLCEAYGMTHDERIGAAAQLAVQFTEAAQNTTTGGWQYRPGDLGDTSSTGWQVMTLRSAQLAGLVVNRACLDKAGEWFHAVASGQHGGLLSYEPQFPPTPTMTAVGVLGRCYLGWRGEEPAIVEGLEYIERQLPDEPSRDPFRSFFITHALHAHSSLDPRWDTWNERLRRSLIETQAKSGCAMGSWYPAQTSELWAAQGGRLLTTSLATLMLAISYEHLPIQRTAHELARMPETIERQ